jgi:hypothetical protein
VASGFEPLAGSTEPNSMQQLAARGSQPLAQTLAHDTPIDLELARVNAAWPDLPPLVRAAVLLLVDTARSQLPNS